MDWLFLAAVPLGLLVLGFPVYLIFLVSATLALLFLIQVPPTIIVQVLFGRLDTQALLAVPFFIFAGDLMARGGIAERLVNWFLSMLRGVRGSLGLVTVASSTFFGAISGTGLATIAAIGRVMYPALIKNGYGIPFSAGLVASAGAIDVVVPPSIAMILYGAAAEQSVAALYLAGFIPGILMGVAMAGYILLYATRRQVVEAGGFNFQEFQRATWAALPAIGMPVVILGGIYSGVFTPTESAGVAAVYGILVSLFVYKDVGPRDIVRIAGSSATITAQVLIIAAASGVFAWLLTVSQVAPAITNWIQSLNLAPWQILLGINILLLLVGMVLDPTSAILVLTPLLVPIVQIAGINLIHFGIIFTMNIAIGMYTPPFGLNIFLTQSLFQLKLRQIVPGLVPFFLVNVVTLLVITYVPDISLFLVRLWR